jgi:protein O-GlcNAc transferase
MSLPVDKALRKAQSHIKAGELAEAEELYKQVLSRFPKNKKAIQGYQKLKAGITSKGSTDSKPPQEQIDELVGLYNQGQMAAVLDLAQVLTQLYPRAFMPWNILGAANKGVGRVQAASEAFKKVTELNPNYADGFNNLGVTLQGQGKLDEAIASYNKALYLKPDYAEAYYNMGNALKEKGDLDAAIDSYKQALKINPDSVDAYNNMGVALKEKGDIDAAIDSYKKAIKIKPGHADAYSNMGNAMKEKGELDAAIDSYKQAIKIKPDYAEAYSNVGNALQDKGDLDAAVDSYKQAIKIKPDHAEAYRNMGNALQDKGELDAAIDSYKQALKINPDNAEAYYNMGNALKDKGDLDAAIESYKQAIKIKPDYAAAYNNMGVALQDKGELDAAIESYEQALKIKPDYAEAYYNMGNALKDKGELDAAIGSYKQAIKIKPDYADAYNNMGNALKDKGDLDAAIESYEQALKIKPDYAEAYYNMGNALKDKGDLDAAIESYEQAIKIKPDHADACNNIGNVLQEKGELEAAMDNYKQAIKIKPDNAEALSQTYHVAALMSDWAYVANVKNDVLSNRLGETEAIYGLLALADEPSIHLRKSAALIANRFKYTFQCEVSPFLKSKKIKIGYFSSYFRQHPVSVLSVQMLEYQNKRQFETFAFHYGPDNNDDYNLRMRDTFDHFVNVSKLSDKDIAELACKKGIDIAIEFNGFMKDGRVGILAHRPAPIQINYLAYPGTMGASFYDYIIADHTVIPEDQRDHYSENIIYLPNCYMPQDNARQISDKQISRVYCGLPDDAFVFCCFNNSFKISPKEFDIWMRLLSKVDGSVLWLLKSNRWAEINLKAEARKRGIDPVRLVFADKAPVDEHLGRLKLADLFLDTFNFNAHTTASDALWAGLPVITKMGKGFSARVAGSLLTALELPEMITTSEKEYEQLALDLALKPDKLVKIRNKLNEKRLSAPLFDTESYTQNLEKAYKIAYQRYVDGLQPAEFKVV